MKQKTINIILYIVSVPIALFEYFVLFWFWSGDGVFTLILTPLTFITYLILIWLMYFKKKIKVKAPLNLCC